MQKRLLSGFPFLFDFILPLPSNAPTPGGEGMIQEQGSGGELMVQEQGSGGDIMITEGV